jgi:hypothetical protein
MSHMRVSRDLLAFFHRQFSCNMNPENALREQNEYWRNTEMKTVYLAIPFLVTAMPATAGSLRFTKIPGAPLTGTPNGKKDLGTIQGDEFDKIKPKIQTVISAFLKHNRWRPKEATWWDIGPDAGYVSAVVDLDGKSYTINSWYPLNRQANIAVSETLGLVAVNSQEHKQELEGKNSAEYKEIVSIFELIPQPQK